MKLFIYYSFTGNIDSIAPIIKNKGYDLCKVEEKKKMPKSFFFSILTGGFRAGMKLKGKLINYSNDISNYDEIVIGSPIWNGRFPPAINSVLAQTDFSNKKVTFVFSSGSGEAPKASKWINKNMPASEIIVLKEVKKHQEELNKLDNL